VILRHRRGPCSRGQALVEFALVVPVFIALVGAIIQFGILFWAQNTLTQVVRDTGRWEATQQSCANGAQVVSQANAIAANSALIGHSSWTTAASPSQLGVYVDFLKTGSEPCPPLDNSTVAYVFVSIRHQVPVFFPGMQYLPQLGTCDASGCYVAVSSAAQFRLEPKP
jgi:hypothetical protein